MGRRNSEGEGDGRYVLCMRKGCQRTMSGCCADGKIRRNETERTSDSEGLCGVEGARGDTSENVVSAPVTVAAAACQRRSARATARAMTAGTASRLTV